MRAVIRLLTTTIVTGLVVLMPVLLFGLLLGEIIQLVIGLATPIADLFPGGTFDELEFPLPVAVLLILAASMILGLLARAEVGRRVGRWLERNTFGRFPLYAAVKAVAAGLVEIGDGSGIKPVLLLSGEGQREFAYLIEEHGDGQATILVPWAPTALAGSVKIVSIDQIERIDARFSDVTRVLSHWGLGAGELLRSDDRA